MVFAEFDAYRGTSSSHRRTPDAMAMTSVPEWDRQFRLVRVHHEHREELGRLRLAGIRADAVAVAGSSEKLCPASEVVTGPSLT